MNERRNSGGSSPPICGGIYFLLFLLVTYQRLALTRLSAEVAKRTLGQRGLAQFTGIHERVLELTGRALFAQVARHRHHHRFYQALQRANQIEQLHQEVRDEVEALKEYNTSLVQRREQEQATRLATQQQRLGYGLAFLSVLAALNLWASKWPRFGSLSHPLSLLCHPRPRATDLGMRVRLRATVAAGKI